MAGRDNHDLEDFDKILVLDGGEAVEFNSPERLRGGVGGGMFSLGGMAT